MSDTAQADDGAMLPLGSLEQTFVYSGDNIITITVSYAGKVYVQTFTYAGTTLTNIGNWELQP